MSRCWCASQWLALWQRHSWSFTHSHMSSETTVAAILHPCWGLTPQKGRHRSKVLLNGIFLVHATLQKPQWVFLSGSCCLINFWTLRDNSDQNQDLSCSDFAQGSYDVSPPSDSLACCRCVGNGWVVALGGGEFLSHCSISTLSAATGRGKSLV